jgi:hypothetical protein
LRLSPFLPLAGLLLSVDAEACPFCHSETAEAVRAEIFQLENFLWIFTITLAPFLVSGGILFLAQKGLGSWDGNGKAGRRS